MWSKLYAYITKCTILTNISPTCLTIYDFMKSLQQFSDHKMWNSKHEYFNGNVISLSCSVYRPGLVLISWTQDQVFRFCSSEELTLPLKLCSWQTVSVLDSNVFLQENGIETKVFSRLFKIRNMTKTCSSRCASTSQFRRSFLVLSLWHLPHYFKHFCKFSKE